ncbi:caspase family protein [Streptomyces sp. NBC_01589]|uniref:caspase family protein n=1 Tax=Streptomyces sp. NBC_01589 TaxID=2975886 RepID=UPI0038641084
MTTTVGDGAGEEDPRRFLIATAVSRYPKCPAWDRPGLGDARERVIELFTGQLGYRHVTGLGLDPTRTQLTDQLRAFCKSPDRREDDLLAVYISGHGQVLDDGGDHVLFTTDTDPNDIAYTALPTVDLARTMLRDTSVRRLLLVLDTCYSGQGGNELARAALDRISAQWGQATGSGMVIISSAQPHQQAQAGMFPHLLTQAVHGWATAGHAPQTLPVDTVVQKMNNNPDRPGHQSITASVIGLTGETPPFLANPRHNTRLTDVDLAIQHAAEFDEQARLRDTEFTKRLLVRAMGYHGDAAQGWWFCGRHRVLAQLAHWLREPPSNEALPCRVVTADPGSGKTAVLGLIAALSDREQRRTVPRDALGLHPHMVPPERAVDVAVYAQSLKDGDVLQALAAALRVRATTVGELLEALPAARDGRPFTALIDALDEAATPDTLCSRILRPLMDHSHGRIRLLLGTRPYLLDRLGLDRDKPAHRRYVIDLDDSQYADPEALRAYTMRNLLEARSTSPYRQHPDELHPVADAVAEAASRSFLVARITASTLAADTTIPDWSDPAWRAGLPRHASQAMREDLTRRLGPDAQRATDLLRPLAFAEGQGLPWEDIWAPLASAISGRPYTDGDLLWLRHAAGSYVVEATESERSAYRLYHQALAEHLRDGVDEHSVHGVYTTVLTQRVPYRADGTRDWSRAHPYTLNYLALHATVAERLDDLLADSDYLVHATPRSLTAHLHHAHSDPARLAAAVYRSSLTRHETATPAIRRQVLALDAARAGATTLHQNLTHHMPAGDWAPQWATGSTFSPALRDILTGHTYWLTAVACTTLDGTPVAVTGGGDDTVRIWDLTTGSLIGQPLTGHTSTVDAVACTTLDGTPVAVTASYDNTVRIWDLTTRAPIGQPFTGHTDKVTAVACTTLDGTPVAVTASRDDTVRIWDLTTGTPIGRALTDYTFPVYAVACTTLDGTPVAVTGSWDGTVRIWDLTTRAPIGQRLTGHRLFCYAVACTTLDGTPVAVTGGGDDTVRIWDLTTRAPIGQPLTGHNRGVTAVACTTLDGTPVAVTASDDYTVRIWNLTTRGGAPIGQPLIGHNRGVTAVACTTLDGTPVAVTGGWDGTWRIWDLTTGTPIGQPLTGHNRGVTAVACTTLDGTPAAVTGSEDRTVRVWDLTTRVPIGQPLTGHTSIVYAVACTTLDGTPVAVTAGYDDTVRVWDLTTGTPIGQPLTGHNRGVTAVACTTLDGTPVAVTARSWECTVRVWDLTTGTPIGQPLTGHTRGVTAVACTTLDGTPVAVTASDDNTVRVWDLRTGLQTGLMAVDRPRVVAVSPAGDLVVGFGSEVAVFGRRLVRHRR